MATGGMLYVVKYAGVTIRCTDDAAGTYVLAKVGSTGQREETEEGMFTQAFTRLYKYANVDNNLCGTKRQYGADTSNSFLPKMCERACFESSRVFYAELSSRESTDKPLYPCLGMLSYVGDNLSGAERYFQHMLGTPAPMQLVNALKSMGNNYRIRVHPSETIIMPSVLFDALRSHWVSNPRLVDTEVWLAHERRRYRIAPSHISFLVRHNGRETETAFCPLLEHRGVVST